MTDPNFVAAEALADELRSRDVVVVGAIEATVHLPQLALEVHTDQTSFEPAVGGRRATVIFYARTKDTNIKGVRVLSTGFGKLDRDAARDAAVQWCSGVYPPLLAWRTQKHVCDSSQFQMIVAVAGTDERYGWLAHLGPIIWRLYGPEGTTGEIGEIDQNEIIQALFNVLHPIAAHRTLFWLECFAVRYPDGSPDATCRLYNEDWMEGEEALLSWAFSWQDTGGCVLSKRQFILFEPVPVSSLSHSEMMKDALENSVKDTRVKNNQLDS